MIRYQKNRLILENNSKELLEKESGGLPFVCNFNESHVFIGHHIPWHWHDWFEINYTERGSFHLQTADQVVEIHQGEAVYINGSVLHAYDFPEDCGYYSVFRGESSGVIWTASISHRFSGPSPCQYFI